MSAAYRDVEVASLAAWPGLRQVDLDGWLLRFSAGCTRRANSVQAIAPSTRALRDKVAECERRYATEGLPCLFRITPFTDPDLEPHLDTLGYREDGRSQVMTRALDDDGAQETCEALELSPWIAAYVRLSRLSAAPGALEPLVSVGGRDRVLGCVRDGHRRIVSVGMGVLDGGMLGLFDLVTDPDARGRGHGRRLILGLLGWGRARGARRAYLQVLEANDDARRLYVRLGFRRAYDYWYRGRTPS